MVFAALNYSPEYNPEQAKVLKEVINGRRFVLVCGGERAGKSLISVVCALLLSGPQEEGYRGLTWIVGPDYKQARAEFEYFYDALRTMELIETVSVPANDTSPWRLITKYGWTFETKTSSDARKLASFAPDVVIMAEAAQQHYDVWLKLRSRVGQKRGHLILSGTLERGYPWYGDMLNRWKTTNPEGGWSLSIPTWSNQKEFPGGWHDPEIQLLLATYQARGEEDLFFERFGAEPRKATGLVIPEFDYTKHVIDLKTDWDIPVELWIDPGKNCYCVLFVQVLGSMVHVLDRVYERGAIAYDVIPKAKENELWPLVQRNTESHGIIDIAGKHQYGLPSHVEVWREEAGVVLLSNYVHQDVSREVVRYRLRTDPDRGHPLLLFNAHFGNAKASDGSAQDVLAEFELYRWADFNPNSSEKRRPIDANNHAIKALGYGIYHHFGPVQERPRLKMGYKRPYWETV